VACPKCGCEEETGDMTLPPLFPNNGLSIEVAYGAVSCAKCQTKLGDTTGSEVSLASAHLLFRLGIATGNAFRQIRLALHYRAQDLAKLFQVRAETISHWENRDGAVDQTAWLALGALLEDCIACRTTMRERLFAALNPAHPTDVVKIVAPIRNPARVYPGDSPMPKGRPPSQPKAPRRSVTLPARAQRPKRPRPGRS
jgi:hypothetical protein